MCARDTLAVRGQSPKLHLKPRVQRFNLAHHPPLACHSTPSLRQKKTQVQDLDCGSLANSLKSMADVLTYAPALPGVALEPSSHCFFLEPSSHCFFPERHTRELGVLRSEGQRDSKGGSAFSRFMRAAEADRSFVFVQNAFGKPKAYPGPCALVRDIRLKQAFAN